jgi:hypothetical protein
MAPGSFTVTAFRRENAMISHVYQVLAALIWQKSYTTFAPSHTAPRPAPQLLHNRGTSNDPSQHLRNRPDPGDRHRSHRAGRRSDRQPVAQAAQVRLQQELAKQPNRTRQGTSS